MIIVNSISERNQVENLILSVHQEDGTWLCYVEGDELPTTQISLERLKELKILELKDSCTTTIKSGFVSNALGENYLYESASPQDQINLVGANALGIDLMFTCTNSSGIKTERFHTANQIHTVFVDGVIWVQTNKTKFYTLIAQVQTAQNKEELDAIVFN